MINKLTAILLMVFALSLFSAVSSHAEAAAWENTLAEVVTATPAATQIQSLLQMPAGLTREKQQALWGVLAQTALNRTGKGALINNLATLTQQTQQQPSTNTALATAVEAAVRSKLEEQIKTAVTERLGDYQEQAALLSALLSGNNRLTPQAVQNNNALAGAPQNYRQLINMTATAYAPGPLDNEKWNDLTYVGSKVKKGVAAVDPAVIPMGTKLWVEGYGEAVAEDQGRAIKGSRIDLAFNTRQEALDYGIQPVKVYVLN